MIDKELFRKTEGRLYRYFRQLKEIDKLKHRSLILWNQIQEIESDIKNTNVTVETSLNMGIDYSKDRVQTSPSGSSYAESGVIQEITKLERELNYKKHKILKLRVRIRELEDQTADMKYNIDGSDNVPGLSAEYKAFIKFKYGEGKSIRWIGEEMYQGAKSTASRKREEIVENIAQWDKNGTMMGQKPKTSMIK